jgi:hypothetical protein
LSFELEGEEHIVTKYPQIILDRKVLVMLERLCATPKFEELVAARKGSTLNTKGLPK